jgi:hypothetical protein
MMRTRGDTLWVFRRPALWCRLAQPEHRVRRLLSEFIGTAGFVSILSGGAAILARYGSDHALAPYQYAFILSCVSALFIVAAVYVPGDVSAHFNPATTFAFALRGDMDWPMDRVHHCSVRCSRHRFARRTRSLRYRRTSRSNGSPAGSGMEKRFVHPACGRCIHHGGRDCRRSV